MVLTKPKFLNIHFSKKKISHVTFNTLKIKISYLQFSFKYEIVIKQK